MKLLNTLHFNILKRVNSQTTIKRTVETCLSYTLEELSFETNVAIIIL